MDIERQLKKTDVASFPAYLSIILLPPIEFKSWTDIYVDIVTNQGDLEW